MTVITLTPEQVQAIVAPVRAEHQKALALASKAYESKAKAAQRRADARVLRARQSTKQWKVQYTETRSKLLAAQAEIVALKRRLRSGEWDA